jgi:site-specific DNA recombinase
MESNGSTLSIGAAYLRCSDPRQDKSIEQQREEIERRAQTDGVFIPPENWFVDEGRSGRTAKKRAAFQSLLRAADDQKAAIDAKKKVGHGFQRIQCMYVWAYSRIARNMMDCLKALATLDAAGIDVISLTEPDCGDRSLRSLIQPLLAWLAERYSEDLSGSVKRGMRSQAEKGFWVYGVAPYGYDLVAGRLMQNPAQAEAVSRMWSLYEQGNGDKTTAKFLTELAVPPPESSKVSRRRGHGSWYSKNVADMITNPVYAGRITYAGAVVCEQAHEPIIEPERFDRVQAVRHERARNKVRGNPVTSGARGVVLPFLRCGLCGGKMHVSHGAPGQYHYACAVRTRQQSACGGLNARVDLLDAAIWSFVQEQVLSPQTLLDAARRWCAGFAPEQADEKRPLLEAEIAEAGAARMRVIALVGKGLTSESEAEVTLRHHASVRARAQDQLRLLPKAVKIPEPTLADMEAVRDRVVLAMDTKSVEARRRALQQVVSAVVLHPGRVTVTYRPRLSAEPEVATQGGPAGSW